MTKHQAPSTAQRNQAPRSATYRTPLMLVAALVGLILMQVLTKSTPEAILRAQPGAARGDVALTDQVLPDEIAGWKKQSFQPAPPIESLPNYQYWWTHGWHYSDGPLSANVSFDQADWAGWHELTVCYTGGGWELLERRIITPDGPDAGWPLVQARFRRGFNQEGWLLFSEFYEDGSPTPPAQLELSGAVREGLGLTQRFGDRVTYQAADLVPHTRVMQCQVFVPYVGQIGPDQQAQLLELHLQSRARFQQQWLLSRDAGSPHADASNVDAPHAAQPDDRPSDN